MTFWEFLATHTVGAGCLLVVLGVVAVWIISAIRGETPW